jgi:hypothetical protein
MAEPLQCLHFTGQEVAAHYEEIVPAYQNAFAGDPWFEVTKCVGNNASDMCIEGLSRLQLDKYCTPCGRYTKEPAYTQEELVEKFNNLSTQRETEWYLERLNGRLAMAILASKTDTRTFATKFLESDGDRFQEWAKDTFGTVPFGWIHEVFADSSVKSRGNLVNFVEATTTIARRLGVLRIAYSTINPRMVHAGQRFGEQAKIYTGNITASNRRTFVVIDFNEDQTSDKIITASL